MKQYFKTFLAIIFASIASIASAQLYVTDDNFADSAQVYQIQLSADGKSETLGTPIFKLPMGDTIKIEHLLKENTYYGATKINGKYYGISSSVLVFSDKNPENVDDIFGNTRDRVNHSVMGKFFATMTPYWIIAILFITAMAFSWIGFKSQAFRKLTLIIVPSCIFIASLLEIWAYWTLDSSVFWWCDPDRYGFFGSLFRVIPFVAFVAFQLYSIKLYMWLITGDEDNGLSVKPLLISIGLCVPLTLAMVFICAGCFDVKSPWIEVVTITTFLLSLGTGLFISTKRNLKELGKGSGTMFTIFGITWAIGAVVAIIGLIMVVFKLILQLLVVVLGFFLMAMMSTRRYKDSWGNVYEEDGFGNRRKIK